MLEKAEGGWDGSGGAPVIAPVAEGVADGRVPILAALYPVLLGHAIPRQLILVREVEQLAHPILLNARMKPAAGQAWVRLGEGVNSLDDQAELFQRDDSSDAWFEHAVEDAVREQIGRRVLVVPRRLLELGRRAPREPPRLGAWP